MSDPQTPTRPRWFEFLQRWAVTTLGVLVAANVVRGIDYQSFLALGLAALVLGLLNAFVRPLLLAVSVVFLIITLGFGFFVINALLLWFVGSLGLGFTVKGFWPAFWGGLVISIVSFVGNLFLGARPRFVVQGTSSPRPAQRSAPRVEPPGKGPVIDV
jgi:putative membrane protein